MRLAERARRRCESKHIAMDMLSWIVSAFTCRHMSRFVDVNFLRPNRERALGWGRKSDLVRCLILNQLNTPPALSP
jgi:hypothetical protein